MNILERESSMPLADLGRVFGLLLLAALAGCDLSGEYDKRFKEALEKSAQRAMFDQNLTADQTEVIDTARKNVGVRLRLPNVFDRENSKSLPLTDARAQPPFVTLPNLSFTYERQLNDDNNQFIPAYLYFAAVAKADQKADALQASLAQQVAAALPGAAWADAQLPTPDGKTVTFKRLRANGQQDFMNLQKNAVIKLNGRFDLYFIDAGAHHVLIGWRAPKAQADKWQFDARTEAAMGTVVVSAPPPGGNGAKAAKASGCF